MNPLVSVVIPTYNHAHLLGRALQSVVDQTYANWEAIVIDNHSEDNTDDLVKSFSDPRITLLKIHNNGVIAASRNMGINVAKGEWVAFLDSDDWWKPEKLQVCMNSVCDGVDLIHHDLKIISEKHEFFRARKIKSWQAKKPVLIDLLTKGNSICNSSAVVRRDLLKKAGGINENPEMIACEDYNTWLRIAQVTDGFLYLKKILGYYFIHSHGVSQKDMSNPVICATREFKYLLSNVEQLRLNSYIKYLKGRHAYLTANYSVSRKNLAFSARHGDFFCRGKSLIMISVMNIRN